MLSAARWDTGRRITVISQLSAEILYPGQPDTLVFLRMVEPDVCHPLKGSSTGKLEPRHIPGSHAGPHSIAAVVWYPGWCPAPCIDPAAQVSADDCAAVVPQLHTA